MNLANEMRALTTVTVGSLPPCAGERERGASPDLTACGLPAPLALPHEGGGNAVTLAEANVGHGGGAFA